MNPQQQEDIAQKIMVDIHRLVQKLKETGMGVDSTIGTTTSVVDETVKYTDSLLITGTFERVRFDPRPITEVKAEAEAVKANIQAQADAEIAKVEAIITKVDIAPAKK